MPLKAEECQRGEADEVNVSQRRKKVSTTVAGFEGCGIRPWAV